MFLFKYKYKFSHFLYYCALALLLSLAAVFPSHSEEQGKASLSDLKSVYIFNFIRFTEWPKTHTQSTSQAVSISVLYDQNIHDTLKNILVKPVAKDLGLSLQACQKEQCIQGSSVLYIGQSNWNDFKQILKQLEGQSVLTISDIPGFAEQGGMVEIKYHNKKLTFVVNLQAVKRADLYISAQLLQLGGVVGRTNE